MRHSILTLPVILSFMKFCVARTFWVECHLDVVLEVLQVVGSKFLFYKTCRDLPLEDSQKLRWLLNKWVEFRSQFEIRTFIFLNTLDYGTLINKEIESISKNFDVFCWNSPRCCPQSSPDDGWIRISFVQNL